MTNIITTVSTPNDVPLDEVVGLLQRFSKQELEGMKLKYPEHEELLKHGQEMGVPAPTISSQKELKVRLDIIRKGLEIILIKADEKSIQLKRRIDVLKNIQLASQIVMAISGASILILLQNTYEIFKIIAACLVLLGSMLTIFVQHKSGTISNGEGSLSSIYGKLIDYKINAEHYLQELIIYMKLEHDPSSYERISQIFQEVNEISFKLKTILQKT